MGAWVIDGEANHEFRGSPGPGIVNGSWYILRGLTLGLQVILGWRSVWRFLLASMPPYLGIFGLRRRLRRVKLPTSCPGHEQIVHPSTSTITSSPHSHSNPHFPLILTTDNTYIHRVTSACIIIAIRDRQFQNN
jgi:hypothetical protein